MPITGSLCFPFNNFKYFLPSFQSSFHPSFTLRSSLSVSLKYLALDVVYHLFRAAIPNYPTLQSDNTARLLTRSHTGFSPSMTSYPMKTYTSVKQPRMSNRKTTIRSSNTSISNLSSVLFTRRY